MKLFALVALFLVVVDGALHASPHGPRTIGFTQRHIDTTREAPLSARLRTRSVNVHPSRNDMFLVHFGGPLSAAHRAEVEALLAPHKLGQYVPHFTYMVSAPVDKITALEDHPAVAWTGHLEADLRVQPDIKSRIAIQLAHPAMETDDIRHAPLPAADGSRAVRFMVALHGDLSSRTLAEAEAIAELWRAELPAGAVVTVVSPRRVSVDVPAARTDEFVPLLASLPEATYVEAKPVYTISNYYSARSLQSGQDLDLTSYLWDAGLTGTGQIVGVADTGLDWSQCYFVDPTTTMTYSPNTMPGHRKIILYDDFVDRVDTANPGHGTHVVGSIVGNGNTGNYALSNGLAYNAKVAFVDIGNGQNQLSIPGDLSLIIQPTYDVGGRIHSNSWGESVLLNGVQQPTQYSLSASELDDFAFNNRDFVFVVAAGNEGQLGAATINSPGTAKNAITVGASQNTFGWWQDLCQITTPSVVGLVVNPTDCPTGVQTSDGLTGMFNSESTAGFSSRGPLSSDQRRKPDIVAPGQYTISAKSSGDTLTNLCSATDPASGRNLLVGTSMAAPLVSGGVALIRNYFTAGYYPSGAPRGADALTPSGSLMKATLLNGASSMTGIDELTQAPLAAAPSNVQGYGRVSLFESLFLKDISPVGFGFYVASNEDATATTGSEDEYCFFGNPLGDGEFKATLVWTDPAAAPQATTALINDLDLRVVKMSDLTTVESADGTNSVEQVVIADVVEGQYCVYVTGANVQSPQTYSLVVGGSVSDEFVATPIPTTTSQPDAVEDYGTFGKPIVKGVNNLYFVIGGIALFCIALAAIIAVVVIRSSGESSSGSSSTTAFASSGTTGYDNTYSAPAYSSTNGYEPSKPSRY